ncbi:unnamed protein product [Prunus brigantina]
MGSCLVSSIVKDKVRSNPLESATKVYMMMRCCLILTCLGMWMF